MALLLPGVIAVGALFAVAASQKRKPPAQPVDALALAIRPQFPVLNCPYVYVDNASTTPKPKAVIDAVVDYYTRCTANVHRSVHGFGAEATRLYDGARSEVAAFLNAAPDEIIFVRGATEAINFVAQAMSLSKTDEIIFPAGEHHANWIPWRVRATPVLVPMDDGGVPQWGALERLITPRTKLIAFAHVSNVTGCVAPVTDVVAIAKRRGIPVLLDAAQSLSHMPIDVQALGIDFLAASSHKAFGPSGVGILWGKRERLVAMPPKDFGGGMVQLNAEGAFFLRDLPLRMEAGTPAIEATIGFGAAVRWMRQIGMDTVRMHDRALADYLIASLCQIPGVRVLASNANCEKIALASFCVGSKSSQEVAQTLFSRYGICVSGGLHCAHVLHQRMGLSGCGTVRASAHVFNTTGEIDRLAQAVRELASG
jgi:cysteine desulfurase/selenocysteine lyase